MNAYKMWIDGKWVDAQSQKTYRIINPATEEEIAQVPLGGKEDIDNAVKAARKAFPAWSGKTPAERSRILFAYINRNWRTCAGTCRARHTRTWLTRLAGEYAVPGLTAAFRVCRTG